MGALISQLAAKARSVVRDLDPQNDLTFLRIRSRKHEIMVAPDRDYILIVIQDPNACAATRCKRSWSTETLSAPVFRISTLQSVFEAVTAAFTGQRTQQPAAQATVQ